MAFSEYMNFNINHIASNEKINDRLVTFVLIGQKKSWKFGFVVIGSGKEDKWMISLSDEWNFRSAINNHKRIEFNDQTT